MMKWGKNGLKLFSLMTARGKKITIIVTTLIIVVALIVIRLRFYDLNLLYTNYTPKGQLVTKAELLHDIDIMQAKDGIAANVYVFPNKNNLEDLPEELFIDCFGNPKEGDVISMAVSNRAFVDSKKPIEVRFFIRIMLYLHERKLGQDVGNIIGLAGGFTRNSFEKFDGEGNQPYKMSVEEFNNLYKVANVSNLDTEKQIEILTDLWIEKTGYWRRGLFGKEER